MLRLGLMWDVHWKWVQDLDNEKGYKKRKRSKRVRIMKRIKDGWLKQVKEVENLRN